MFQHVSRSATANGWLRCYEQRPERYPFATGRDTTRYFSHRRVFPTSSGLDDDSRSKEIRTEGMVIRRVGRSMTTVARHLANSGRHRSRHRRALSSSTRFPTAGRYRRIDPRTNWSKVSRCCSASIEPTPRPSDSSTRLFSFV